MYGYISGQNFIVYLVFYRYIGNTPSPEYQLSFGGKNMKKRREKKEGKMEKKRKKGERKRENGK
jgi:hypothetical protein